MEVTFTNGFGELISPLLLWVRETGFFEAHVYLPIMTLLSIPLYLWLARRIDTNGTFEGYRARHRKLWLALYYGLCFLATNALAVGCKTLIVEELDYPTRVWFEAYVGPLHFYIASVVAAFLLLLIRNGRTTTDIALGIYAQIGLIGGYWVAIHRVLNENISILEPTTGISGFVLAAYFFMYNYDLYKRARLPEPEAIK